MSVPSSQESLEEIEVSRGYQRHYARFPVKLSDGRWAWREFVYRHRKLDRDSNRYFWQYHEGTLSFRSHMNSINDMSEEEILEHRRQKGTGTGQRDLCRRAVTG